MTPPAQASQAFCTRHASTPANATCERCCGFICALDAGGRYPNCSGLPDVAGPEAYRARAWGKRDGLAWAVGLVGLWNLTIIPHDLMGPEGSPLRASIAGAAGILCAVYWWGWRPMRAGIFLFPVAGVVETLLAAGRERDVLLGLAVGALLSLPFVLAWRSTRNRLFFRVEVSPRALEASWRRYVSPNAARLAFALAALSLVLPPLALVSVPLCVSRVRRTDPVTGQPLPARRLARAGVVVGGLAALILFVLLYDFFSTPPGPGC